MDDTIIICTKDELIAMHECGEISDDGYAITMQGLFEVLCDYYQVDPSWQSNDVY